MKDGSSFGIGGIRENWKEPQSGEWLRTFVIVSLAFEWHAAEV
jgi:hypothetical protein